MFETCNLNITFILHNNQSKVKDVSMESINVSNQKKEKHLLKALSIFLKEKFSSDPAMSVEVASRFLFPIFFIIFNIIYWSYYLS